MQNLKCTLWARHINRTYQLFNFKAFMKRYRWCADVITRPHWILSRYWLKNVGESYTNWWKNQKLNIQGVALQHRRMMDVNCIVFEAYFQRHCVTLLSVLCTFFIGFPHFGNKILYRFAQDSKKQEEDFSFSWIIWEREDEVNQSSCCYRQNRTEQNRQMVYIFFYGPFSFIILQFHYLS